jgi:uncharacterized DUF497 family protein
MSVTRLFRWVEWNTLKIAKHGVSIREAEHVVRRASRPFPKKIGRGKWHVQGRGGGDRMIQVVYIVDPNDTVFVIHAMPLTTRRRRG